MGIFEHNTLNNALSGFSDLFGSDGQSFQGNTIYIETERISTFKNHPFKVIDDERMEELVESVREVGVLTPVLVRKSSADTYEMLSGHRRLRASEIAGVKKIPARVLDLDDDDAAIFVVDSNIQREEILPSEKAFAYRMKLEAMARKAGRKRKDSEEKDQKPYKADLEMSQDVGDSRAKIRRFIRLTKLISPLLDRVDRKELGFLIGVELSFIPQHIQEYIDNYLEDGYVLKRDAVGNLRNTPDLEDLDEDEVFDILNGVKREPEDSDTYMEGSDELQEEGPTYEGNPEYQEAPEGVLIQREAKEPKVPVMPVSSSSSSAQRTRRPKLVDFVETDLNRYFPPTFSEEEIKVILISLLEVWLKTRK